MRAVARLAATLCALALVAFAVIFTIEVVAARAGDRPVVLPWHGAYAAGERTPFSAGSLRAACVVLVLAGLLLLALVLRRSAPTRLETTSGTDGVQVLLSPSGVQSAVRVAVEQVDGVRHAQVSVGRGRVGIRVVPTTDSDTEQLRERAGTAAAARLDELALSTPPRLQVGVQTASGGTA